MRIDVRAGADGEAPRGEWLILADINDVMRIAASLRSIVTLRNDRRRLDRIREVERERISRRGVVAEIVEAVELAHFRGGRQ